MLAAILLVSFGEAAGIGLAVFAVASLRLAAGSTFGVCFSFASGFSFASSFEDVSGLEVRITACAAHALGRRLGMLDLALAGNLARGSARGGGVSLASLRLSAAFCPGIGFMASRSVLLAGCAGFGRSTGVETTAQRAQAERQEGTKEEKGDRLWFWISSHGGSPLDDICGLFRLRFSNENLP